MICRHQHSAVNFESQVIQEYASIKSGFPLTLNSENLSVSLLGPYNYGLMLSAFFRELLHDKES